MDAGLLRVDARTTAPRDIAGPDRVNEPAVADGPLQQPELARDARETQAAAGAVALSDERVDGRSVLQGAPRATGQALDGAAGSAGRAGGDAGHPVPKAFIWNHRFFTPVAPPGGVDVHDEVAVDRRVVRSVVQYLLDEEPDVDDFAVNELHRRAVDKDADADLLHVNPGAMWVYDVVGVNGAGIGRTFPVVMNDDGSTFVDPRVHM